MAIKLSSESYLYLLMEQLYRNENFVFFVIIPLEYAITMWYIIILYFYDHDFGKDGRNHTSYLMIEIYPVLVKFNYF